MVQEAFSVMPSPPNIVHEIAVQVLMGYSVVGLQAPLQCSPCSLDPLRVHRAIVRVHEIVLVVHPLMVELPLEVFYSSVGLPAVGNDDGA